MAFKPKISYRHTLSEFSVNRKDPCEVIRELISNSYDAAASRIEIYSLMQYEGFIHFDDGCGMSEVEEINGITPCQAFFSVGTSTKTFGENIGYKCQGSKLCFACRKFTLITRCQGEESWRIISLDNPADNLTEEYIIDSKSDDTPWVTLKDLFPRPDTNVVKILDSLNETFFQEKFTTGSMIIVQEFKTKDFRYYFNDDRNGKTGWSYIRNYIRFNTRYGDMRILRAETTGFPLNRAKSFPNTPGYNDKLELYLWVKKERRLEKIPVGYPYLAKPSQQEHLKIDSPAKVGQLSNGKFYAREATNFPWGGNTYSLVLAIDGNSRALKGYEALDRRGKSRSGIRLTDQRGVFICSQGVKICQYNEILTRGKLGKYEALTTTYQAQSHYIFMINGNFELVTDRNSLSEKALTTLQDNSFLDKIVEFLDRFYHNNSIFKELIDRLENFKKEADRNKYIDRLDSIKEGIKKRRRFMVSGIEQLEGKWLVEPLQGEEHWVGALYTLFAHLISPDLSYAHLWLRPRNFSGIGIDSIAVDCNENSLKADVHKGLEYKYEFSANEPFNHLLTATHQIVCWEMSIPENGVEIKDDFEYKGYVSLENKELQGIGYEITHIQSDDGDIHGDTIKVISLRNLIDKTFKCEWSPPL